MAHAFFPECLSKHCHGLRRNVSEICTKFDARLLFLRQIHPKITSGQTQDYKQKAARTTQHVHPTA
jgi:hypothetical protein